MIGNVVKLEKGIAGCKCRSKGNSLLIVILFVVSIVVFGVKPVSETEMSMSDISLWTVIAAWWGAGIATIVFVFEFYKWIQTAPRIDIGVSPDMRMLTQDSDLSEKKYLSVTLSNNGGKATTVTLLGAVVYKSRFSRWRRKQLRAMIVPKPITSQSFSAFPTLSLPALLEVGRTWTGLIEQTEELTKWIEKGQLYIGVFTSYHKRPLEKRIIKKEYVDSKRK